MLLTVGQVVRPHGVRGEVLVETATDEPEQRYAAGAALHTAAPVPGAAVAGRAGSPPGPVPPVLTVATSRPHQGRLLVGFREVGDRDAAEPLRGVLLQVDSGVIPTPSDPEEFRDHQLVGLTAVNPAGVLLGTVASVDHAPAADLLVLDRPGGGTVLVPFVTAIVTEVDLAAGRLVVDPPAGLLEL